LRRFFAVAKLGKAQDPDKTPTPLGNFLNAKILSSVTKFSTGPVFAFKTRLHDLKFSFGWQPSQKTKRMFFMLLNAAISAVYQRDNLLAPMQISPRPPLSPALGKGI
jgi:hypothetical protein